MFRYDLHTHSCASHDCQTRYPDLIDMARRRGLNGIALTDHDTMDGYFALRKIWPSDEMELIPGCERTLFDKSHIIGLFLRETLHSKSLRDVIVEIRDQGGLVYLPHPFREYSGILGAMAQHSEEDRVWAIQNADIIEVYNRKCTTEENRLALKLADEYAKGFAGGSDAHHKHEIGYGCTLFEKQLSPTQFQTHEALGLTEAAAAIQTEHRAATKRNSPRTAIRNLLKISGLLKPVRMLRNHWLCSQQPSLVRYR